MKTKAYSKEGLSAAARLEPREQAKLEAGEFLGNMVDELELQIEAMEAESESISATMKKGKNQGAKADRIAEIDDIIERHKWHQGKLELIRRSLENGGVETEQVNALEDDIRYYVTDHMNPDYVEDDTMYDDLDLEEEEGAYGIGGDTEKDSSQDVQSVTEESPAEPEPPAKPPPRKAPKEVEAVARKASTAQTKSPLPALATLHTPISAPSNVSSGSSSMKPASVPTRPAGEGLKYASAAAAAAAASEKSVGISPLPPPPGAAPAGISPLPPVQKSSATSSPAMTTIQPASVPSESKAAATASTDGDVPPPRKKSKAKQPAAQPEPPAPTNGVNGIKPIAEEPDEESVYHLPSALQDLVDSFETSRKRPLPPSAPSTLRVMSASQATCPDGLDADIPKNYRPDMPVSQTGSGFPREPLSIFDDPRLYSRIDPDTLFYVFYYKQGSPQQYLAAKALKDQSWRFHKQYQTWFQRHEEPKNITEEFEQGTYRFFDYESTWYVSRTSRSACIANFTG